MRIRRRKEHTGKSPPLDCPTRESVMQGASLDTNVAYDTVNTHGDYRMNPSVPYISDHVYEDIY